MTETLPGAGVPNPLDEAAITAAVDQAVAAIAAASTLDELKAVRLAHTGEKSALSLANREIGGLPKDQKAAAGKHINGKRNGCWETWHDNGQVASKGTYSNDKAVLSWLYWTPTGEKRKDKLGGEALHGECLVTL